jgi:fructokinase
MIVSCGEALIDLVPDPLPGGGPLNVAIAAARLGAPVAFVGALSTDGYGNLLDAHLRSNGVDMTLCSRSDAATALAIVEHEPILRFRFEGAGTADTQLESVDLTRIGDGPHIVHGGTLGMFRGTTAHTLADLAEKQGQSGGIVSLDPNVRPQIITDSAEWHAFHDRWLPHVAIYKGSDEDLDWIWPGRTPESCADELLASGTTAVIITRGGDGLTILTSGGEAVGVSPRVEVVDTVGAGDTIVGAVLTQLWELGVSEQGFMLTSIDLDAWTQIAQRAVDAAAITCTRAGANGPLRGELDW